ncbi:uncharacterized FCP1 homology domain-containing protein-like protein [Tanacetum coccineum]
MGTKDSKIKNVVASDDTRLTEKEEGIKNAIVASDGCPKSEEGDKKEAGVKNVVGVSGNSSTSEKQENEKEAGVDLGIPMDKLSLGPKKKLLVLPLGGIIVHRAHRSRPNTISKNRSPDFSYGYFLVYKRPYCEEFLKFCFERFEVGLWSSAREHNLTGVLTNVIGELKSKFLFTWDQKQCMDTGFKCLDNKDKPLFLKELSHLWEKKYSDLPWRVGEYSSSNTFQTLSIFPRNYDPENKEDDFLGPDGELRVFLDGLAEAKDVPTYVKDHPIGEPAITSSHPDWDYYSKINRSHGKKETRTN